MHVKKQKPGVSNSDSSCFNCVIGSVQMTAHAEKAAWCHTISQKITHLIFYSNTQIQELL